MPNDSSERNVTPAQVAGSDDSVSESIQHRCSRMAEHHTYPNPLERPCPECYSLRVTAERIPYEPDVRWHPVQSYPRPKATPGYV